MPQILQPDRIGNLSHSSGTITLAPSLLTIGGQQYSTGTLTRLISTDVTLAVNSLYMIYAVVVGGAVQLRISSNLNSVGPTGFSAWRLVGAFYSNALSPISFGSFVNITGVPATLSGIEGGPLVFGVVSGTAPTKAATRPSDRILWRRMGDRVFARYEYEQTGSGTAGSGHYTLDLVPNLLIDTTKQFVDTANNTGSSRRDQSIIGHGTAHIPGAAIAAFIPSAIGGNRMIISFVDSVNMGEVYSSYWPLSNSNIRYALEINYPVQGWSNTPLIEL